MTCPHCDEGKGWVYVTDTYAHRQAAHSLRNLEDETKTVPFDPDNNPRHHERLVAYANTVHPCRHCQPQRHQHWSEGHLDSDHHCTECANRRTTR